MACEATPFERGQTLTQRKQQVTEAVASLARGLVSGSIKLKLSPQGAVAFDGWQIQDRKGISDACALRKIMVTGSALAKAKVQAAQALLGKPILTHGAHSHDGGATWHPSHKH